ncbi:ring-cleaving dioxygenase [Thermomicrobiaceae bacterium CFH 74404]|uniref:Ring-cleaving dioxygenase n=1 Tax=Thermalbibacter longus TaxID=2951981 RepID=A0AA41WA10_9BACT|nr:ring-cleaving dioxygenase [Thermalbibacter longus]MCM8748774.1 ring-cleaving dioxygenase [Thermalbibacter longus]
MNSRSPVTELELGGIHHVTAVTGRAAENVRFYTRVLGMRLVKKTVNQDDVSAYHLFYGDETGSPGTEVTFFDWPDAGPHRPGAGEVATIALGVPGRPALQYWTDRLDRAGIDHQGIEEYGGRGMIRFTDPEGQRLALIDASDWPGGSPWRESPVPAEFAIRGIAFVALVVRDLGPTEAVLRDVLGFRWAAELALDGHRRVVFETGPGGPGAEVHVEVRPELPRARTGIGGVHHVAFRTPTDEQHRQWHERVAAAGLTVTPVIDRYYFRSLYFREPGGVLFEIATDGPGFAVDEDPAHLGERLALPPFLEPYRAQIEAGLRPLVPAEEGH